MPQTGTSNVVIGIYSKLNLTCKMSRYWNATSIEEKLNDFLNILNATLVKTIPRKFLKENTNTQRGGTQILLFSALNVGN